MQDLEQIIKDRRSVRAFTGQPVSKATLEPILQLAAAAPSGSNTQPWRVYAVTGTKLSTIVTAVTRVFDQITADPQLATQYPDLENYYPRPWFSPYLERRRQQGWDFYNSLGIAKGDMQHMNAQTRQNFTFFGAPVGIFITLDRRLGDGSKIDLGLFLENILLAATAAGLGTCVQAAWNRFQKIILPHLAAGENEILMTAVALGYADPNAAINKFTTTRVKVNEFTDFLGFTADN